MPTQKMYRVPLIVYREADAYIDVIATNANDAMDTAYVALHEKGGESLVTLEGGKCRKSVGLAPDPVPMELTT